MYDVAGGAQNYQFGSAFYHSSSKYYDQRPRDDENNKQDKTAMEVDESKSNNDTQKQYPYPWLNAYVIKAPSQPITRGNKPVNIQYPHPCKVSVHNGQIVSFDNGQVLGVEYAKPNDDLRVRVMVSNLERDTVKVSKQEVEHMKVYNLNGDNALGKNYPSILEQQNPQSQYQ
eukprot:CAMPEP_0201591488 /NCGR_PEP_ID=MMETSP0190_2-20130828/189652_1 /ASSEMBLY_ACC=CAM_ASM_000263 /TAXON_ID=37353 /ORGANISM="Rosalina sp." /LENGTH=171 /DNA_ID=CAMNT_0048049849 /DNA_START=802 /DNA_END=1317 /DNA_ORIENTATION=+